MNENDLPEDLSSPTRGPSLFHDPMFWLATALLVTAVTLVAVGISNGAMR